MAEDEETERYNIHVRKDVYATEKEAQREMCKAKHKVLDFKVADLEKKQRGIENKITATLVFTIATLVGIAVVLATRL